MAFRSLLCLGMVAWAACSPASAAGNVIDCSQPQVRVDVSRLDGGSLHLFLPEELSRFYPDRARRMGVSGMAIVVCSRTGEVLDCAVQETTPADWSFEQSVRLPRLLTRWISDKAIFRMDYTILSPGSCYAPFTRAPDWRLEKMRPR